MPSSAWIMSVTLLRTIRIFAVRSTGRLRTASTTNQSTVTVTTATTSSPKRLCTIDGSTRLSMFPRP